ncbi:sulfurtransferase TusA family protein [Larsenimonas rhizosphaerae]|uniref:sulfurtransferase TusA family protein n=1 Tax=Larsenimonas rhizosphaerae TaxID=2944682 RepID=UPI002033CF44|nr:sulfurtransferase TusA family protein [Larsenimonas rhizosphaerae]
MATSEQTLDARGLDCPLPLLQVRQRLTAMQPGEVLHVEATDPGSWRDFESYAAQGGHTLTREEPVDGVYRYCFIKGVC